MYDDLIEALRVCVKHGKAQDALENAEQAADAIEELSNAQEQWIEQERNALLKSIPRWIPVTERLPERGQDVLVMVHWRDYPEDMMCYGRKYKTRWYLWNGELGEIYKGFDITHWMPLPEPPTAEEGE